MTRSGMPWRWRANKRKWSPRASFCLIYFAVSQIDSFPTPVFLCFVSRSTCTRQTSPLGLPRKSLVGSSASWAEMGHPESLTFTDVWSAIAMHVSCWGPLSLTLCLFVCLTFLNLFLSSFNRYGQWQRWSLYKNGMFYVPWYKDASFMCTVAFWC